MSAEEFGLWKAEYIAAPWGNLVIETAPAPFVSAGPTAGASAVTDLKLLGVI